MKLIEIRNKNGFKSHDETIKELIEVLDFAEDIARERDSLKQQLETLTNQQGYHTNEQK